jgi:hypothetical protein
MRPTAHWQRCHTIDCRHCRRRRHRVVGRVKTERQKSQNAGVTLTTLTTFVTFRQCVLSDYRLATDSQSAKKEPVQLQNFTQIHSACSLCSLCPLCWYFCLCRSVAVCPTTTTTQNRELQLQHLQQLQCLRENGGTRFTNRKKD